MARNATPDPSERVRTYLLLGRDAEALAACSRALTDNPTDTGLLTLSSIAAYRLGQHDDAIRFAMMAISSGPDSDFAHRTLATALLSVGRVQEATSAAYTAAALAPHNWINHLRYSQCLMAMPDSRDAAWQAATRAVELAPHESLAHYQVACVVYPVGLSSLAQFDLAERAIREALRLEPSNATYQHELARLKLARTGVDGVGGASEVLAGFTGAVIADPIGVGNAALENIRRVVRRLVLVQGLWVMGAACLAMLAVGNPPSTRGRWGHLAIVASLIAYFVVTWRRNLVGTSQQNVVRQVIRRDRRLSVGAVLLAAALLVMAAGAFLPGDGPLMAATGGFLLASVAGILNRGNSRESVPG
ncbi:MAG: Tetratricopeptide repeat protein [bacterium ADurb.BinA028]|jgi:Flp pilus assembly protein TadD|nr:MAG: Tetratricopeptide repeat protein [bacterium ADurb.BinA028]